MRLALAALLAAVPSAAQEPPAGGLVYDLAVGANADVRSFSAGAARRFAEPLEAGFNLDVAGVAAGGTSKSVSYRASPSAAAESVGAAPARGNLFLYGSNDIGSLNSEFYAAWRVSRAVTVRGGLSHFLAEYRADREGTTRFRRFMNLAFVAVRWTP